MNTCEECKKKQLEIERLTAALRPFADRTNWYVDDSAQWTGDDDEPWDIARRALDLIQAAEKPR